MTRIVLVDEDDQEIGLKERSEVTAHDIFRVSALWLTNSKREILIARRALTKDTGPGKWGPAVAGRVDEGETYLINMIKEAQEEIGLTLRPDELREGPKIKVRGRFVHFVQWYYATVDAPLESFVLQEEEVMNVKWVTLPELLHAYEFQPDAFSGAMNQWLPQVLDGQNASV